MTSIGLKTVTNTPQVQPSKNKVAFKSSSPESEVKADELIKSMKPEKPEKKGFLRTINNKLAEIREKTPVKVRHALVTVAGGFLGEGLGALTGKTRNKVIGAVIGAVSMLGVSLAVNKSEPKK